MFKTRKLAYGDGNTEIAKPRLLKRLGFSGIALLLATTTNCGTACAIPQSSTVERIQNVTRAQQPRRGGRPSLVGPAHSNCMPEMEEITVRPGERRLESVCRADREYVLTDSSLYMRRRESGRDMMGETEIRLLAHTSITDISGYASMGIVRWLPTEDSVLIITRDDRRLTILPDENMGETVPSYVLPFDLAGVTRQRVAYQSGFLFIAPPASDMLVMGFGDHAGAALLHIRSSGGSDGFYTRDGRLFFGVKEGEGREIRISGPTVNDVSPAL